MSRENESGETLVAWKFEGQVQWQLYDESDRAIGEPGKAKSGGAGLAIAVTKDGEFVVFR